jgi:hypothetical protein
MTMRGVPYALAILLFIGLLGVVSCSVLSTAEAQIGIELWSNEEIVAPGECSVIHWEVSNAEAYPIFFNGEEVLSTGQEMVCPEQTTEFKLVVLAPSGPDEKSLTIFVTGGSAVAEPTTSAVGPVLGTPVPTATPTSTAPGGTQAPPTATRVPPTATAPPPAPPEGPKILYFRANGQEGSIAVNPGTTVTLSWEWERVSEGHLDPGNIALACPAMPCSYQVTPGASTTYTLRAVNPSGSDTKAVTVNILAAPSPTPTNITGVIVPATLAEIIVVNNTTDPIASVHFRATGTSDWGQEMLASGNFIMPGGSEVFQVLPGTYDLMATAPRGTPTWATTHVDISEQYVWNIS